MRTLFIGGTKRGYLTLKALLEHGANVVGVIILQQDPHETERYEATLEALAAAYQVPSYSTRWMKDRDYADLIANVLKPDIAFVVGCRILIPRDIYAIPRLGTLAVHDSLLPEYRGFAPLNWAIINGEDHTGVSLFRLSKLMDGGDIIAQRRVPIGRDDTAPMVYERVCQATIDLVLDAYPGLEADTATSIPQNYSVGSFTCSRTPTDGLIDWHAPTHRTYNLIRALTYPYPGAWTFYQGKPIIIWRATLVEPAPQYVGRIPGRIVRVDRAEGFVDVLTGDGILRVFEVQANGENKPASEVLTSVRATLGLRIDELLQRIEALEQQIAHQEIQPI